VNLVNPADITIRTPASGSTVGAGLMNSGFLVTVDTWADALAGVKVWIDDNTASAQWVWSASYSVSFSSGSPILTPGAHTIHAAAYTLGTNTIRYETSIPFNYEVLAATITAPAPNANVGGIVPIVVDVTQGHPDRMELEYPNRSGTGTTLVLTQAPWVFWWDTTTAPNRPVGLFTKVREGTGVIWLPTVVVNVKNGDAEVVSPQAGATLSGTTTVTFNALANVGKVDFLVDGSLVDSANHDGTVDFPWNTRAVANGAHTVTFLASNTYGWSQAYNVAVTVQNSTDTGTLSLNLPPTGAAVSGLSPVSVTATGGAILKQIDVSIDGVWRAAVTQAPFTWTWDTRGLADGKHGVQVVATRASGATQTFAADVTVDNLAARFTAPAFGAVVKGTKVPVALVLQAGQAVSVTFGVDAKVLEVATKAPYSLTWNSTTVPDGAHTLWAVVKNAQGGTEVAYVTLTVRNDTKAPVVTLTAPAANAKVGATTTVKGKATDAGGVARVDLYLDNKLVASTAPTGGSFSLVADLSKLAKGAHRIKVAAVDRSGNIGWSAVRTIKRV
jgi:Bacterial Ig domain